MSTHGAKGSRSEVPPSAAGPAGTPRGEGAAAVRFYADAVWCVNPGIPHSIDLPLPRLKGG